MRGMIAGMVISAVAAFAAVAQQLPQGGYAVSGYVNGTAAMGPTDQIGGQTGQMTTTEWGTDDLWYNSTTDEYLIKDRATGNYVGEMTASPDPNNSNKYNVTYYDMQGHKLGEGTWQKA